MEEFFGGIANVFSSPAASAGAWLLGCSLIATIFNRIERILPNSKDDIARAIHSNSISQFLTRISKYAILFIDQIFLFKSKSVIMNFPSVKRSIIATLIALSFFILILEVFDHSIFTDITELTRSKGADPRNTFEYYSQYYLGISIFLFGFIINIFSDYFSLYQTRISIHICVNSSNSKRIFVIIFDALISILILVVFTALSVFLAYSFSSLLVINLYNPAMNDNYSLIGYAYYSSVIGGLYVIDGAISLFNYRFDSEFFRNIHHYVPFLNPSLNYVSQIKPVPSITSLLVLTNLTTSIWLWFFSFSSLIQYLFSKFPKLYLTLLRWTDARNDPYKFLKLISIILWSALYPIGLVFG